MTPKPNTRTKKRLLVGKMREFGQKKGLAQAISHFSLFMAFYGNFVLQLHNKAISAKTMTRVSQLWDLMDTYGFREDIKDKVDEEDNNDEQQ